MESIGDSSRTRDEFDFAISDDASSHDVDLMVKDDKPPQENDAKCGFTCHSTVKNRDYVFTDYGHR